MENKQKETEKEEKASLPLPPTFFEVLANGEVSFEDFKDYVYRAAELLNQGFLLVHVVNTPNTIRYLNFDVDDVRNFGGWFSIRNLKMKFRGDALDHLLLRSRAIFGIICEDDHFVLLPVQFYDFMLIYKVGDIFHVIHNSKQTRYEDEKSCELMFVGLTLKQIQTMLSNDQ